ncbi:MAG: SPASM domain-containing protein [Thermodesulfobacteriota bacterium]
MDQRAFNGKTNAQNTQADQDAFPRAFLSLITNGDLLSQALHRSLRTEGLDALGVSIYDDKTFIKAERMKDERLVMLDMRHALPGRLENRGGNIKQDAHAFEDYQRKFVNQSCERPFSMMTINPKGQAVLCCSDMYSDVVMGDVKEQRLEEIWNSKLFNHYRRTLNERGRKDLKLCEDCSHDGQASTPFYPLPSKPKSDHFEGAVKTIRSVLGLDKRHV